MLPAEHRLRSHLGFTEAVRRGRRAGRPTLTVHLLLPAAGRVAAQPAEQPAEQPGQHVVACSTPLEPVQAGLIVSKAVGGSVVRHQVARRLRHVLQSRVARVPVGSLLVVRASPAAAAASSARLAVDVDAALAKLGFPPSPVAPPARPPLSGNGWRAAQDQA